MEPCRFAPQGVSVTVVDANALLIDDPELTFHALNCRESHSGSYKGFYGPEGLLRRTKHPDSWMRARRVGSDVLEAQIGRDLNAVLRDASTKHTAAFKLKPLPNAQLLRT